MSRGSHRTARECADSPFLTPTRRKALRMLDLPTLGMPATSMLILSSGPSRGRLAIPVPLGCERLSYQESQEEQARTDGGAQEPPDLCVRARVGEEDLVVAVLGHRSSQGLQAPVGRVREGAERLSGRTERTSWKQSWARSALL